MEGRYQLTLDINDDGFTDPVISNRKKVPVKFVEAVVKYLTLLDAHSRQYNITGYTACKLEVEGREELFRATSNYGSDGEWYDWCLIEWDGYIETYPARILGFFQYDSGNDRIEHAVIKVTVGKVVRRDNLLELVPLTPSYISENLKPLPAILFVAETANNRSFLTKTFF